MRKPDFEVELGALEVIQEDHGSAPGKIRTCDLCLRRAALYPLSYGRGEGECSCVADREP